jgi:hypothetical protein
MNGGLWMSDSGRPFGQGWSPEGPKPFVSFAITILKGRSDCARRRSRGGCLRITFDEGWVGVDLTEYFRRSDCVVEHAVAHGLDVKPRHALLPQAAKLELEGLLRVWCKLHPEASISTWGTEQAPRRSEDGVLAP